MSDNSVVPGRGDIYAADVGTEIPRDPDSSLGGDWTKLGLVTEDSAGFNRDITIEEFMCWQQRTAFRREVTAEELVASFEIIEWKRENWRLAFGGGEFEAVGANTRYTFPTGADALTEWALMVRWQDGDKHYQLGFEQGNPTEGVEVGLARGGMSVLPVSFKALAGEDSLGVTFDTDDPAFLPEGS